jgi:hypothetical protein
MNQTDYWTMLEIFKRNGFDVALGTWRPMQTAANNIKNKMLKLNGKDKSANFEFLFDGEENLVAVE